MVKQVHIVSTLAVNHCRVLSNLKHSNLILWLIIILHNVALSCFMSYLKHDNGLPQEFTILTCLTNEYYYTDHSYCIWISAVFNMSQSHESAMSVWEIDVYCNFLNSTNIVYTHIYIYIYIYINTDTYIYGYICLYLIYKESGSYKDQCSLSCLPTGPYILYVCRVWRTNTNWFDVIVHAVYGVSLHYFFIQCKFTEINIISWLISKKKNLDRGWVEKCDFIVYSHV